MCLLHRFTYLLVVVGIMSGCSQGPLGEQANAIRSLENACSIKYDLDESNNVVGLQISSPEFKDEDASHIASLVKLKRLNLKQAGVSDDGLRHVGAIGDLQVLYLDKTAVTGAGLGHLAECKDLEEMTLAECEIDNQGAAMIGEFSSLRLLDLSKSNITDQGLISLASLTELETLYLRDLTISGRGFAKLGALSKLRMIDISGVSIDQEMIDTLSNFAELDRLYIGQSNLDDKLLPELIETLVSSNPKLRGLALPDVPLTDASIESLKRLQELPELVVVDIRNTQITKDAFLELIAAVSEVNFSAAYPD